MLQKGNNSFKVGLLLPQSAAAAAAKNYLMTAYNNNVILFIHAHNRAYSWENTTSYNDWSFFFSQISKST